MIRLDGEKGITTGKGLSAWCRIGYGYTPT
jgi:hypothetical protein